MEHRRRTKIKEHEELTLETFGEIIDGFLEENPIQMIITMPEGTRDAEVTDNTGMGPVIQFYIMLHAIGPIYKEMCEMTGIDPAKNESLIEGMTDLIAEALRKEYAEETKEDSNGSN